MASAYFKQFAIDNQLTVDYGYMYGKYRDFYISLKESIGSTRILTISTTICQNVDNLKKVLSVFTEDELPKYCITDMKRENNYIQFTFEILADKAKLIHEFLDKFIDSYIESGLEVAIICPICNEKILPDDEVVTIDMGGILTPVHNACYEKKNEEKKALAEAKTAAINEIKATLTGDSTDAEKALVDEAVKTVENESQATAENAENSAMASRALDEKARELDQIVNDLNRLIRG